MLSEFFFLNFLKYNFLSLCTVKAEVIMPAIETCFNYFGTRSSDSQENDNKTREIPGGGKGDFPRWRLKGRIFLLALSFLGIWTRSSSIATASLRQPVVDVKFGRPVCKMTLYCKYAMYVVLTRL